MKSDRFLQSMSRIVDRYMVVNLDTGRYRYHELRSREPLYPTSGQYSKMVEIISKRYVALTETENAKLSRLLEPDYLRLSLIHISSAVRWITAPADGRVWCIF